MFRVEKFKDDSARSHQQALVYDETYEIPVNVYLTKKQATRDQERQKPNPEELN